MNTSLWAPQKPHNQLPPLPPQADCETRAILRACIPARAAIAELKQAAGLLPSQAILINAISPLEAQASSEIENIVTTADALFQFPSPHDSASDPATKEAQRYRTALFEGFRSLIARPLSTGTAIEVCSGIKHVTMDVRRVPGTRLTDHTSGGVIYTPPEGEPLLRSLLQNWESFMHESELDPLIRMAVAHYQFEAIHPFTDGNGRTGRILNILFLVEQGLLTLPILYLSRYIIANKVSYYRLLLEVTRTGDWESWILFMLEAVKETATWTTAKIHALRALLDTTIAHVRSRAAKIYSRELIDVIFEKPYARISDVVEKGIAARQTASRYLGELVRIGVLEPVVVGREKLFVHSRLLRLLTRDGNAHEGY